MNDFIITEVLVKICKSNSHYDFIKVCIHENYDFKIAKIGC